MTGAPDDIFLTLRQMVHGDPALQAKLFALTDAREFDVAVRNLAKVSGLALTESDVLQALRTGRRGWSDRKLP